MSLNSSEPNYDPPPGSYTALALARFADACDTLQLALRLADRAAACPSPASADVRSDALLELSRALRYQGRLGEAVAAATAAAESRRAQVHPPCAGARLGAALHELGVLRLRLHDGPGGEALLCSALSCKRSDANCPPSEVASTLHALAVAAMHARPPRLDVLRGC